MQRQRRSEAERQAVLIACLAVSRLRDVIYIPRGIMILVATGHGGILRISFNSRYSFILLCVTVSQMQLYSKHSFHISIKDVILALALPKVSLQCSTLLASHSHFILDGFKVTQKRQHALHVSHGFEKKECSGNWTRR